MHIVTPGAVSDCSAVLSWRGLKSGLEQASLKTRRKVQQAGRCRCNHPHLPPSSSCSLYYSRKRHLFNVQFGDRTSTPTTLPHVVEHASPPIPLPPTTLGCIFCCALCTDVPSETLSRKAPSGSQTPCGQILGLYKAHRVLDSESYLHFPGGATRLGSCLDAPLLVIRLKG